MVQQRVRHRDPPYRRFVIEQLVALVYQVTPATRRAAAVLIGTCCMSVSALPVSPSLGAEAQPRRVVRATLPVWTVAELAKAHLEWIKMNGRAGPAFQSSSPPEHVKAAPLGT